MNLINQLLEILKEDKFFLFIIWDNFWGTDLADMQLISKHNKTIRFLLCVIDLLNKYAWVVSSKDKKVITIVNAFQSILNCSKRKPKTMRVDQEFCNSFF